MLATDDFLTLKRSGAVYADPAENFRTVKGKKLRKKTSAKTAYQASPSIYTTKGLHCLT